MKDDWISAGCSLRNPTVAQESWIRLHINPDSRAWNLRQCGDLRIRRCGTDQAAALCESVATCSGDGKHRDDSARQSVLSGLSRLEKAQRSLQFYGCLGRNWVSAFNVGGNRTGARDASERWLFSDVGNYSDPWA